VFGSQLGKAFFTLLGDPLGGLNRWGSLFLLLQELISWLLGIDKEFVQEGF